MSSPIYLHVGLRSQQVTEAALAGGFDGVIVDLQHGELDLASATSLLRSVPDSLSRTLVRVPSLDPGVIGCVLDAGAGGIVAPCVESVEQARALVAATKYAPVGGRSLGPMRPGLYDGPNPTAYANQHVKVYAQIESLLGVERRAEILGVPGIEGVYIGPADLALTMGETPRLDWEEGPVRDAIDQVLATARDLDRARGIFALSGRYARELADEGRIDFAGLGTDLSLVAQAAGTLAESYRG